MIPPPPPASEVYKQITTLALARLNFFLIYS